MIEFSSYHQCLIIEGILAQFSISQKFTKVNMARHPGKKETINFIRISETVSLSATRCRTVAI